MRERTMKSWGARQATLSKAVPTAARLTDDQIRRICMTITSSTSPAGHVITTPSWRRACVSCSIDARMLRPLDSNRTHFLHQSHWNYHLPTTPAASRPHPVGIQAHSASPRLRELRASTLTCQNGNGTHYWRCLKFCSPSRVRRRADTSAPIKQEVSRTHARAHADPPTLTSYASTS